jgi:NADPH:quinone reductase-like Zn-dependent oxidoreductase
MKAMVYRSYGPPGVLHIEEIEKPRPKSDEILIKIIATSIVAGDWRLRKADPFLARLYNGLFRPKKINILGFEFSGTVESTGGDAQRFKPGDSVFAYAGLGFGGYAEYKCLPENGSSKQGLVALKPENLSYQEAAVIPLGCLTALTFLQEKGHIESGQSVLIYGASGSVGSYAVQLAKYFGAEVTGVCSGSNLQMVRNLGADHVIDYTTDDLSQHAHRYDIVFDTVPGLPRSMRKKLLKDDGRSFHTFQSIRFNQEKLDLIRELCENEALKPVIDRVYEFEDLAEAHTYVEDFHKKGNVVIKVSDE